MISTDAQDRLNRLFANSQLPTAPTSGKPHFSEKEIEDHKAREEQPWRIPEIIEQPRKFKPPPCTDPLRDFETLTSSDDDEYVALFKKKPSMRPAAKQPQAKPRKMPERNAFGYPKDAVIKPKGPIEYLAKGEWSKKNANKVTEQADSDDEHIPTADDHGSKVTGQFCQFLLAAKFPYKYMNDPNDRVSRHFFASNKFYAREWDLYYLHAPFDLGAKPIVLVPREQMQQLITEIAQVFKVSVSMPKFPFTLTFYADGTPQPTFLGKSSSRDDAHNLQANIPAAPDDYAKCPPHAALGIKQKFEDFKNKCQGAISAKGKDSNRGRGKTKREDDPLFNIKDWCVQLRRAQRYLGLRQKSGRTQLPDQSLSWDEQERFKQGQLKKVHLVLDPLDLTLPAPFPFEKVPVIIAIDIESYERAHNLITEIGISTLDTLDLVGIAPGPNGKNWSGQIRSRHFRISGREHLVNREFCIGHPEDFQFGKSEWVDLDEAVAIVDSCFEWPFSVHFKHASLKDQWVVEPADDAKENRTQTRVSDEFGGVNFGPTNAEQDAASRAAVASILNGIGNSDAISRAIGLNKVNQSDPEDLQHGPKERNVIIIGHDIRTDVDYLRVLGSKIFSPSRMTYPIPAMDLVASGDGAAKILVSIVDSMDTGPLYRVLKEEQQNRKLSTIMSDLGLQCLFPHNGGNDARYTLEAWVAMLIHARLKGDMEQKKDEKDVEKMAQMAKENDTWNQGSEWGGQPSGDPGRPCTPGGNKGNDLDSFEAVTMPSSPKVSPPSLKDDSIATIAEKLQIDSSIDHEEEEEDEWCL